MLRNLLPRLSGLEPGEGVPALTAGSMFFCLMCSYFILKPLRDEMGIAGGVDKLPYLYLVTLAVMLVIAPLFGAVSRGRHRETFLPRVYRFLGINLLAFFAAFTLLPDGEPWLGRVFYVWVSVFNLFSLSLFWGFMADILGYRRGRRVFGVIAVGGTAGAIVGSSLTTALAGYLGRMPLLLISLGFLELAVRMVGPLSRRFPSRAPTPQVPEPGEKGSIWAGVTLVLRSPYLQAICAFMVLYSLSSTFIYFIQANIVAAAVESRVARAQLLGGIEIWVQSVTLLTQLSLTGRLLRRFGSGPVLATLPLMTALGFGMLSVWPGVLMLVVVQVLRRALNYALVKPARESLYTPLHPSSQYRAKNFVDTFVYRGGDALGASVYRLLGALGLGLSGIAAVAVPVCALWGLISIHLGRRQDALAERRGHPDPAARAGIAVTTRLD